jgi:nucleotide-binding universal stress UspA family protein
MAETEREWKVLVPVEVLEGESVPETVAELLATVPVVVLGYHVLPEQTPPDQARLQFEERAQAALEDLAAQFRAAGGDAETRLVFTHDEEQTLTRVADETGCGAYLIPNPTGDVERLLVPVGGEVDLDRLARFAEALVGGRSVLVTLYHVAATDEGRRAGEEVVAEAATRLHEAGLPADRIRTSVVVSDTPVQTVATAAEGHDAVVMGESAPSLRALLFGATSEQVASRSLGPVVVVRRAVGGDETESESGESGESEPGTDDQTPSDRP